LLTTQHLALQRAALQFFEEELCPHGPDAMRSYFDEPFTRTWKTDEVRELRNFLKTCELGYVRYDRESGRLRNRTVFDAIEETHFQPLTDFTRIVPILIPAG